MLYGPMQTFYQYQDKYYKYHFNVKKGKAIVYALITNQPEISYSTFISPSALSYDSKTADFGLMYNNQYKTDSYGKYNQFSLYSTPILEISGDQTITFYFDHKANGPVTYNRVNAWVVNIY